VSVGEKTLSRFKAAGLHFVVCALVAAILFALVWFVWYPAPTLIAIGGHQIFALLVTIDVIIGPLLTLVVFKQGKKTLKFDLAVIAALQIAALVYGTQQLLEARPVYIAALGDKFQVIQAPEISPMHLGKTTETLPWFGPKLVGTRVPDEKKAQSEVRGAAEMGVGAGHFPQYHVPYAEVALEVAKKALPISKLKELNPNDQGDIDRWLAKRNLSETQVVFQPVQIAATDYAVILARDSGSVIGIAPFRPWP
jgi:hypothetical protein